MLLFIYSKRRGTISKSMFYTQCEITTVVYCASINCFVRYNNEFPLSVASSIILTKVISAIHFKPCSLILKYVVFLYMVTSWAV